MVPLMIVNNPNSLLLYKTYFGSEMKNEEEIISILKIFPDLIKYLNTNWMTLSFQELTICEINGL